MLQISSGSTGTSAATVTKERTALAMGSGSLPVFATPAMVALMEEAACTAVSPFLEEGETTVGTSLSLSHSAPTPLGAKVTATATLTEVDRRRLVFRVECRDEAGIVGAGTHERFLVDSSHFLRSAEGKAGSQ